ncbi:hypothetical protein ACROYT_G011062 [Oculina patagonica]
MLVIDKRKVKDKGKDTPLSKDDVRICIYAKDLNKALKRPHYPMVTVEEVANRLLGAQSFTSLDECSGYWQFPVDDESSKLLTFNTPWGRYRVTRLPFGISPAPEIYQREMDKLFEWVPVEILVDDFLIHGLKPDPEKIRAINEMPLPEDKEGILRILGTVNYLDKFIEHKADIQEPISQLTQKDAAFVWEKPQQEAFDNLKSVITSAPALARFDDSKETVLNVDASSKGLGAVILQEGKPVAFRSKTLTTCERRYANIERELLAIVWVHKNFTHTYTGAE